jgi:hypothetical protein
MNDAERYVFDLYGYIHIPALLTPGETHSLYAAAQALVQDAQNCRNRTAHWLVPRFNLDCWQSPEHGYFSLADPETGQIVIIDDFWLYPEAFDMLIGHERTMTYIRRIVQGPVSLNNSQMLVRAHGHTSGSHGGCPGGHGPKYRYQVVNGEIDCMMVRMVYFLHDVPIEQGPMCFAPGSHRGVFPMPCPGVSLEEEPGMIPVPVKAGDALLFTEACRHGGYTNRTDRTRLTLHVGYGPAFMPSQNIATMDEAPYVTDAFFSRLRPDQRALLARPDHRRIKPPG